MYFEWPSTVFSWLKTRTAENAFPVSNVEAAKQWHEGIVAQFARDHAVPPDSDVKMRSVAHQGGTNPNERDHITAEFSKNGDRIPVKVKINGKERMMNTVHCYTGR
ncbi:hypothetical protein M405DRAFT_841644 [Rhizopogon salebrosus TDB-379]|nr:hypothetical protein M405DRAFT_841644 [Rhizopogon salebrosus TDB-379]